MSQRIKVTGYQQRNEVAPLNGPLLGGLVTLIGKLRNPRLTNLPMSTTPSGPRNCGPLRRSNSAHSRSVVVREYEIPRAQLNKSSAQLNKPLKPIMIASKPIMIATTSPITLPRMSTQPKNQKPAAAGAEPPKVNVFRRSLNIVEPGSRRKLLR